jgi:hypothetical protein
VLEKKRHPQRKKNLDRSRHFSGVSLRHVGVRHTLGKSIRYRRRVAWGVVFTTAINSFKRTSGLELLFCSTLHSVRICTFFQIKCTRCDITPLSFSDRYALSVIYLYPVSRDHSPILLLMEILWRWNLCGYAYYYHTWGVDNHRVRILCGFHKYQSSFSCVEVCITSSPFDLSCQCLEYCKDSMRTACGCRINSPLSDNSNRSR